MGTPEKPAPTADYFYVQTFLNGQSRGRLGMIQPVDRGYLEKFYGPEVAVCLKAVGRLQFSDQGTRSGWDGASYLHRDDDSENYRGYFVHSINQTQDDWSSLVELTRVLDARHTPTSEFDAQIHKIVDVDAFLRIYAVRELTGDWDAFGVENGHNGYIVLDPEDNRWELIPFDMDHAYERGTNPQITQVVDREMRRMLTQPTVQRVYLRVLWESINNYWNTDGPGPWLDAMQAQVRLGSPTFKNFLRASATWVERSQLARHQGDSIEIHTNDGEDFETEETTALLEGFAPLPIASIQYRRNDGPFAPLEVEWKTGSIWNVSLELPTDLNEFQFVGLDGGGNLYSSARITIRSLANAKAFLRGDCNGDSSVDGALTDAVFTLNYTFLEGPEPPCLSACDTDGDGSFVGLDRRSLPAQLHVPQRPHASGTVSELWHRGRFPPRLRTRGGLPLAGCETDRLRVRWGDMYAPHERTRGFRIDLGRS